MGLHFTFTVCGKKKWLKIVDKNKTNKQKHVNNVSYCAIYLFIYCIYMFLLLLLLLFVLLLLLFAYIFLFILNAREINITYAHGTHCFLITQWHNLKFKINMQQQKKLLFSLSLSLSLFLSLSLLLFVTHIYSSCMHAIWEKKELPVFHVFFLFLFLFLLSNDHIHS